LFPDVAVGVAVTVCLYSSLN